MDSSHEVIPSSKSFSRGCEDSIFESNGILCSLSTNRSILLQI